MFVFGGNDRARWLICIRGSGPGTPSGRARSGLEGLCRELPSVSDSDSRPETSERSERGPLEPPVDEGETRVVETEGLGDQGDGFGRADRGFVVIVLDTDKGERVRVEITDVCENVAFETVVERLSYYE